NSCDDSDDCTENDICSGGICSGTEIVCSDPPNMCMRRYCDHTLGYCVDEWISDDEPCDECHICQNGECNPSEQDAACSGCYSCDDSSGRLCTRVDNVLSDPDPPCQASTCPLEGTCNMGLDCVIDVYCDDFVDPGGCNQQVAVYGTSDTETLNCRLPADKVELTVIVDKNIPEPGGFVPVTIQLSNPPTNSVVGEWQKGLFELSLRLEMNPPDPDNGSSRQGTLFYVLGSARLNQGELAIQETVDDQDQQVILMQLGGQGDSLGVASESDGWELRLMLARGANISQDAAFKIEVLGVCASASREIGCHSADGRQRISPIVLASPSGGTYQDDRLGMLQSQKLGCQCGSAAAGQAAGIVFLVLIVLGVIRRKRR
ncbi:MAG: hypothetical protein JRJ87_23290, partial [Deltaproteobacteria bacterium]|nr:hypothetical protein [Deltaproteobacteria bacterium]